jgi:hypothetical protein
MRQHQAAAGGAVRGMQKAPDSLLNNRLHQDYCFSNSSVTPARAPGRCHTPVIPA